MLIQKGLCSGNMKGEPGESKNSESDTTKWVVGWRGRKKRRKNKQSKM